MVRLTLEVGSERVGGIAEVLAPDQIIPIIG